MHVIHNSAHKRGVAPKARARRTLRSIGVSALQGFISLWKKAFPMPSSPGGPDEPSPIAKAAALRDPALLTEQLDAVSDKKVG